jgi:hypothetical protein
MKMRRLGELLEVGVPALLIIALGATAAFAGGGVFAGGSDTTVTSAGPTAVLVSASSTDTTVTTAGPSALQVSASSTDTTVTTAEDQQIVANQAHQGNPNQQQIASKPAHQGNPNHRQIVAHEADEGNAGGDSHDGGGAEQESD